MRTTPFSPCELLIHFPIRESFQSSNHPNHVFQYLVVVHLFHFKCFPKNNPPRFKISKFLITPKFFLAVYSKKRPTPSLSKKKSPNGYVPICGSRTPLPKSPNSLPNNSKFLITPKFFGVEEEQPHHVAFLVD